jgi:hypothetical protein
MESQNVLIGKVVAVVKPRPGVPSNIIHLLSGGNVQPKCVVWRCSLSLQIKHTFMKIGIALHINMISFAGALAVVNCSGS